MNYKLKLHLLNHLTNTNSCHPVS